ncbi:MAG TPA: ABC transporter permease, partial [Longimicrobiales bacterium]
MRRNDEPANRTGAMPPEMPSPPVTPPPALPMMLLAGLLAEAERDEVLADIRAEHAARCARSGRASADAWVWRQAAGSIPSLMRRSWWRGWNGFESQGNRNRPGGPMLEQWIQDARFAMRRLRKRPLFAVLAVMTLALGVGGTAAVYSLVRTVLLEPLPYGEPEQIATFWNPFDWSQSEHLFLQDYHPGFEDIAAYRRMDLTLSNGAGGTLSVPSILPSANLFDVLKARPMLGQTFQPGDDRPGAASVMVISHSLWRELGSNPAIIGTRLELGGEPHTVIGVMPRGFWFPDPRARLWVNSPFTPDNRSGNYAMVGRLEAGRTFEMMSDPLTRIASRLRETYNYPAQWDKSANPVITPITASFAGTVRPMLLATLAAMALILLIACTNVAALMLGQVDSRSTELAVRSALGANRRQLLQQLVIETIVLGLCAGITGSLLAAASFNLLTGSLPLGALMENATLDWSVFSGAMVISLIAAAVVAAAPAMALWRGDLNGRLTRSRTSGIGARGGATENALVIVEVALAVLLVAGAALLIRTVLNLRAIDPGVATEDVAVVDFIT